MVNQVDIQQRTPAFIEETERAIAHVKNILELLTDEDRRQNEIIERRKQLLMLETARDGIEYWD